MKISLNELALETTRRCNLRCAHCMRGASQNIDLTKDIVDKVLSKEYISKIKCLVFSGGEPTLNSEVIIYTIDKIIDEELDVYNLRMVTNGQIFVPELMEAFNRFNEYRNKSIDEEIEKLCSSDKTTIFKTIMKEGLEILKNKNVNIIFSNDQFHKEINRLIVNEYLKYSDKLNVIMDFFNLTEEDIIKTGFSTIGKEFQYELYPIFYSSDEEEYTVKSLLYITANGYVTSNGDGQYADMDTINIGHISDVSLYDLLCEHGIPLYGAKKIINQNPILVKK